MVHPVGMAPIGPTCFKTLWTTVEKPQKMDEICRSTLAFAVCVVQGCHRVGSLKNTKIGIST